MNDVLNYEIVATKSHQVRAMNWLNNETSDRWNCRIENALLRVGFASLDDAFRFRLSFDEALVA